MTHTKLSLLVLLTLLGTGCQHAPFKKGTLTPVVVTTDTSWNGMHIDVVQFVAQENGFSCLTPSGVNVEDDGRAVKKTFCFKTEGPKTSTRIFYLDAHSMLVTSTTESIEIGPVQ